MLVKERPHITFLFACPRYFRVEVPDYCESYDPLPYQSQFETICELAQNLQLTYKKTAATVTTLE